MKMQSLILIFCMLASSWLRAETPGEQFPSSTKDLLLGCKNLLVVEKHNCSLGNCKEHTEVAAKALASFNYIRGFVASVRTTQAIGVSKRMIDFPEDGINCRELIEPLITFIEKDAETKNAHASVTLFIFLTRRFRANS